MKTMKTMMLVLIAAALAVVSGCASGPAPGEAETLKRDENGKPLIPVSRAGDFEYEKYRMSNGISITGYKGASKIVGIPDKISGRPVKDIAGDAFRGKELIAVSIPNSVLNIYANAFRGNKLTTVVFRTSQKASDSMFPHIEDFAFADNEISELVFPEMRHWKTYIGNSAFENNCISGLVFSEIITQIGDRAFAGNRLTSVSVPAWVKILGANAFADNPLDEPFVIPPSVETVIAYTSDKHDIAALYSYTPGSHLVLVSIRGVSENHSTTVVIPDTINGLPVIGISQPLNFTPLHLEDYSELILPANLAYIDLYGFRVEDLAKIKAPNEKVQSILDTYTAKRREVARLDQERREQKEKEDERRFAEDAMNFLRQAREITQ
ncbi:MAG: leucine-rich repeat domain-containing protein [Treponema sp.]|jgi:hypothetical protein|nr:leucine-rich repeat domain-containing protein [Treponema sp.]